MDTALPDVLTVKQAAWDLYKRRPDELWSLTDRVSLVTMAEHGLQDAFTSDHNFEQAGFTCFFSAEWARG